MEQQTILSVCVCLCVCLSPPPSSWPPSSQKKKNLNLKSQEILELSDPMKNSFVTSFPLSMYTGKHTKKICWHIPSM